MGEARLMTAAPEPRDVDAFRSWVARRLGLSFDEGKRDFLGDVLRQRVEAGRHGGPAAYLQTVEANGAREEVGRLAEALTVGETFFFRNKDHFRALTEAVLPERVRARAGQRRLRLLSAGCASGEEAYSLAMVIRDHFPDLSSWDVRIRAADVNPAMLARAAQGRFSPWALRDTPPEVREKHFRPEGRDFHIGDGVKALVAFEERNLAEPHPDLWEADGFDLIFCRNMLMYWVPEAAAALVARMGRALTPGGYLFLGNAETLRGLSQDFHLCHTHDTFYYQRREGAGRAPSPSAWLDNGRAVPPAEAAPAFPWDPAAPWMEVIQRASEKIAGLAARAGASSPAEGRPAAPSKAAPHAAPGRAPFALPPAWDLGLALDLLGRERFAEALEALRRLPPESGGDPDVLLLRAVLLTNVGDRAEAEIVCRRLLGEDELNAGAHYLTALCREQAGDLAAAEEHDRTAVYLDAGFAMPWLHLGLLARRGGRPEEARRCLDQAMALLAKEDASRVLLFGGGFGREALAQLCRSELRALEEQLL